MIFVTIGLIVGIIMGLTGAGGALISIPLFISLLDSSLKEATVLSLIAVILGTLVNLTGLLKKVNLKISLIIGLSGALSNFFSSSLKSKVPDSIIAVLLLAVGAYSLIGVWKTQADEKGSGSPTNMIPFFIVGLLSGILTTFTGLGGGVILMPVLMMLMKVTYKDALPTSLATILIISLTSFIIQASGNMPAVTMIDVGFLAGGTLLAVFLLKILYKKLNQNNVLWIRRIVFTLVTVYSVTSILVKTFWGHLWT